MNILGSTEVPAPQTGVGVYITAGYWTSNYTRLMRVGGRRGGLRIHGAVFLFLCPIGPDGPGTTYASTAVRWNVQSRGVKHMAYTPHTWSSGDIITAALLNALEQGVGNAHGTSQHHKTDRYHLNGIPVRGRHGGHRDRQ